MVLPLGPPSLLLQIIHAIVIFVCSEEFGTMVLVAVIRCASESNWF